MKRIVLVLPAALALLACLLPSAASGRIGPDSYCSLSDGYCIDVFRGQDGVKLSITTVSVSGDYMLCIDPPTGRAVRDCASFGLREKPHGVYSSRIDLQRYFAGWGPGIYAARWYLMRAPFSASPALRFELG
jgi:hypothetical protein